MKNLGHVMIDLETMGNTSFSAIVSIGAVEFNPDTGETGREFYKIIDLESCFKYGLHADSSTIYWWLRQDKNAKDELYKKGLNIESGLMLFNNFIEHCGGKEVYVWGNSARFDLGILENACKNTNKPITWDFRKEMCLRTLGNINPFLKMTEEFTGVKHNAIDDCKHQIKYLTKIYKVMNKVMAYQLVVDTIDKCDIDGRKKKGYKTQLKKAKDQRSDRIPMLVAPSDKPSDSLMMLFSWEKFDKENGKDGDYWSLLYESFLRLENKTDGKNKK